ncbi:Uncharacterised protein [Phocoenobacter uteri]|uniref:Lipoprotein n=1 Tax=Phocoenobacter uteri TaxID=146806 RepID=A0A379CBI7_9PAST|nr:hypothetical protein [Phocoenobacter uteri]SUB59680.1 Uncharacterised protein [Phocoenobacter uteri]
MNKILFILSISCLVSCTTTEKLLPNTNELECFHEVIGENYLKRTQGLPTDSALNKVEYDRCIKNHF